MKKILYVASECVPFIKTGGLADVVGTLPKTFSKEEADVRVVLPNYSCMKPEWKEKLEDLTYFSMDLSWRNQYVGIKRHQNRRKRAVSLAVGINNCAVCDFAVLHGIYLKLFGVAEMLKNLSVFMCYCNFHNLFPRFIKLLFIALQNSLRSLPSGSPA